MCCPWEATGLCPLYSIVSSTTYTVEYSALHCTYKSITHLVYSVLYGICNLYPWYILLYLVSTTGCCVHLKVPASANPLYPRLDAEYSVLERVHHRVHIITRDETGLVCLPIQLERTLQLYW